MPEIPPEQMNEILGRPEFRELEREQQVQFLSKRSTAFAGAGREAQERFLETRLARQQEPSAEPSRPLAEQAERYTGLGAKGFVRGAVETVLFPGEAALKGIDVAYDQLEKLGAPAREYEFGTYSRYASDALIDALRGNYEAESPSERIVETAGEYVGGGAATGGLGAGAGIAARAGGAAARGTSLAGRAGRAAVEPFARNPAGAAGVELAGSAGAGAGAGVAREVAPDSQAAEIGAALLGGLATGGPAARRLLSEGPPSTGPRPVQAEDAATAAQGSRLIEPTPIPPSERPVLYDARGRPLEGPRVGDDQAEDVLDAVAGREARPAPEEAGNLNLRRVGPEDPLDPNQIQTADDVKRVLSKVSDQYSGFEGARRGVVSWEETQDLADRMGLTVEQLSKRRKGEAFNAHEAKASMDLMTRTGQDVVESARQALATGGETSMARFREALARHAAVQEQVAGITAEAGRALNIFNKMRQVQDQSDAIASIVDWGGGKRQLKEMAKQISDLHHPAQVAAYARKATKATIGQKLIEAWKMALLSGPQTHIVNTLSNTVTNVASLVEDVPAALIGKLHGGEKVYVREVLSRISATGQGVEDGLWAGAQSFRAEGEGFALGKVEVRQPSIEGRLGSFVRLPGRMLTAEDEFFKGIARAQEINAQALRDGIKKGLRGRELAEHVARLKEEAPEWLTKEGENAARYLTFTNDLGTTGAQLQRTIQSDPRLQFIAPFVRTPINIVKFAVDRSPVAFASKKFWRELAKGGVSRDRALARVATGSAMGMWAMSMAMDGRMTGAAPRDPGERQVFYDSGRKPYSVKVGDRWVSYGRIEPLGSILGLAADYALLKDDMSELEQNEIAGRIVFSFAENLAHKTFLKGASDLVLALRDPDRYAERWVESAAGSVVPAGVAQVARSRDPVLREAHTLTDAVMSRIPGLREQLPVRRTLFGEPASRGTTGSAALDLANPLYTSEESQDPAMRELSRLEVSIRRPDQKLDGLQMTPDEYDQMARETGAGARELVQRVMQEPGYAKLPDEEKRLQMRQAFERARAMARERIRMKRFLERSGEVGKEQAAQEIARERRYGEPVTR